MIWTADGRAVTKLEGYFLTSATIANKAPLLHLDLLFRFRASFPIWRMKLRGAACPACSNALCAAPAKAALLIKDSRCSLDISEATSVICLLHRKKPFPISSAAREETTISCGLRVAFGCSACLDATSNITFLSVSVIWLTTPEVKRIASLTPSFESTFASPNLCLPLFFCRFLCWSAAIKQRTNAAINLLSIEGSLLSTGVSKKGLKEPPIFPPEYRSWRLAAKTPISVFFGEKYSGEVHLSTIFLKVGKLLLSMTPWSSKRLAMWISSV
mmetsp:Transcript_23809/g.57673  ORF Transcript_23809/g.57673 Transcript_23809/m.57673 type:complete len:271 (-) Transcript_23809:3971-4783(-)